MAQYPIPQFIESEGKIISFLTFRQFFILVGGGAICLGCFYLLPFFLFVMLGTPVALATAAIAFLKIDNESITTVLLNFFTFSVSSKDYVWQKGQHAYPMSLRQAPEQSRPSTASGTLSGAKQMVELRKK